MGFADESEAITTEPQACALGALFWADIGKSRVPAEIAAINEGGQNGAITKVNMKAITLHAATAPTAIVVTTRSVRRSVVISRSVVII
jgi:hypothetical protein